MLFEAPSLRCINRKEQVSLKKFIKNVWNVNSFSVVSYQAAEDDESFITTDSFYTSELVMIIRAEEKK